MSSRLTLMNARKWASSNLLFLFGLGAILVIFAIFGLLAANAPGLYMDAINPDYEVVKIRHPDAPITVWEAPGDLLFGRFPIMFGLYAGSYITYWMLPFSQLFGDSILSVRIARVCFGLLFLCIVALLCRQLTRSNRIALAAVLGLAVDPTFVYGHRTQAYVVLFPLLFILAAMFLVHRYPRIRTYFAAGVLIGLAAFGYFVYIFILPGVALFAIRDSLPDKRGRTLVWLTMGVCIGLLPYALAYGLLFETLGWSGGLSWLQSALAVLHVTSDYSYLTRLASTITTISSVLNAQWLGLTFWQVTNFDIGQAVKQWVVVGLPFGAFLALHGARSEARRGFAIPVLSIASFVVCATYFGPRLGGHDLTAVVTLTYVACAIGAAVVLGISSTYRKPIAFGVAACAATVIVANFTTSTSVAAKLAGHGGGGFYSLAISKIPEDAKALGDLQTPYVFQTWGEMMPFIYETDGTIPAYAGDQLVAAVCRYGRATVVLLGNDAVAPSAHQTFPPPGLVALDSRLLQDSYSGFPYRVASIKSVRTSTKCTEPKAPPSQAIGVAVGTPRQAMLKLSTASLTKGVIFEAQPNPVSLNAGAPLPIVRLHWDVPGATSIEIRVGTPDGTLFSSGGSAGSALTGPWVQNGNRFFLEDLTAGAPGKTVATITVTQYQSSR